MEWVVDKSAYILRYHMPCDPTYDEETFLKRNYEMVDYCVKNQIPACMIYVDLNPNWYHMPDSLEHTKYYKKLLLPVAEKMREKGISYQLNYQNLVGAWNGGADLSYVNEWENWVDGNGDEAEGVACSIGKKFREIAGEKLRLWSETKPDVIWIDDDVRFHNHMAGINDVWAGKTGGVTNDFGCFCDEHMKLFNQKTGLDITRTELLKEILNGGEIRAKWLEFSGECASEFMGWIEKTIHSVSPDTRIAVMTSLPDVHNAEGRDWKGFLESLSGNHKPLLRPHYGPYQEGHPHGFFPSYLYIDQLKADIRSTYGNLNFDFCPEIENTRFTKWSKSITLTEYQMMISAICGCSGTTFSIFDLEGCVLDEMPEFADMFNEMKPVLNKLSEYDLWNWKSEGLGLITVQGGYANSKKNYSTFEQMCFGRMWDTTVIKAGVPCRYITPDEFDKVNGVLLDAYAVNLLTNDDILKLLSKNVLIDSGALELLEERGFSEYLGVKAGKRMDIVANYEVFENFTHADGSKVRLNLRIHGGKWNNLELAGAKKLSTIFTPLGTEHIGFTYYENSLGGKVYAYIANGTFGEGFFSNWRIKLLKQICQDISNNNIVEINNASYALTISKTDGKKRAVMITNKSSDMMDSVEIKYPEKVNDAIIITKSGECIKPLIKDNKVILENINLNIYNSVVCITQ